jgi:hypothetical protein
MSRFRRAIHGVVSSYVLLAATAGKFPAAEVRHVSTRFEPPVCF